MAAKATMLTEEVPMATDLETKSVWLESALNTLPREATPSRDLWPGIAARIVQSRKQRVAIAAMIAAVTLAGVAAVFAYQSYRLEAERVLLAAAVVEEVSAPFRLVRANYQTEWQAQRALTEPTFAAEVDRNLAILAAAQHTLRAELEERPYDVEVIELLRYTVEREVDLLADVTRLQAKPI